MSTACIATLPFQPALEKDDERRRFEALVSTYSSDLYRYAWWLCRNKSVAEDLVQETFLRAWRARDSMREQKAAKAWLLTILRREHARQFERRRPELVDVEAENQRGWDDHDTSTEAFVLRRALAALPLEYREPLVLQVLGGYATAEIAEILGLTRGAVMTRVFRAKQKLRDALVGKEEVEDGTACDPAT